MCARRRPGVVRKLRASGPGTEMKTPRPSPTKPLTVLLWNDACTLTNRTIARFAFQPPHFHTVKEIPLSSEHLTHDADMPPMTPSMEATKEQLKLAREQGDVFGKAMAAMHKETGQLAIQRDGDYEIAATVEDAEGMYHLEDGKLRWVSPVGENAHIEVVVHDASDGRFIPNLTVTATLVAPDGSEVGTAVLPFLWHPMLYHYGLDWKVPEEGDYRVRVHVDPPKFWRHDYKNGERYASAADVDLTLHIKPGQKFVKGKETQVRR